MSDQHSCEPSPEQVFSSYGLHRALGTTIQDDSEIARSEKKSKDHMYRQYITEREGVLLNELEYAGKAFDQVADERDAIDEDAAINASRSAKVNSRYLQANVRLAKAGQEYRVFVADIEELLHVPNNWTPDHAQAWSDRKTLEKAQRDEAAAEMRVRDRYEARLREANDHRILLAEQNLELMQKVKNSMIRQKELASETYDLGVLLSEATDKFASLGYTWVQEH